MRGTEGFSLVEMLTVLVLVGIVSGLAAPSLSGYVQRHKARRALDQIAADVALARISAVRSGQRSFLTFSGASRYRVEVVAQGETAVREVGLETDYAGVVVIPPAGRLEFNSRGLLVSDLGDGYIVVAVGETRDSLMLTPAGRLYRDF